MRTQSRATSDTNWLSESYFSAQVLFSRRGLRRLRFLLLMCWSHVIIWAKMSCCVPTTKNSSMVQCRGAFAGDELMFKFWKWWQKIKTYALHISFFFIWTKCWWGHTQETMVPCLHLVWAVYHLICEKWSGIEMFEHCRLLVVIPHFKKQPVAAQAVSLRVVEFCLSATVCTWIKYVWKLFLVTQ